MCGIAGFCNMPADWQDNILRMNERMIHRGPDAGGYWANEDATVAFGHRRLSIIDLSDAGAQPMHSASDRYVCVFNGEIYNHKTIADKLLAEDKVRAFRGTSDTEVLLEAVEAYGVKQALGMCKGMFAVAFYDREIKRITLARDRIGEKPLYYGFVNGSFVFASDINCIRALKSFNNEIDTKVLPLYFIHGYIPAPYSIYKGIYKLDAGCMLEIDCPYQEQRISSYWSVRDVAARGMSQPFKGSRREAADELERLLKEAIREQMVADVPVGAFLSAGIDSSTVVSLMQAQSVQKVKTFTIGMNKEQFDEAKYAAQIAKRLGTEHTELYISEKEAQSVIPKIADIFGEPFADSSQIPTYLVSKLAKQNVKVSLSGDGGDELFLGYNSYFSVSGLWKRIEKYPHWIRKLSADVIMKLVPANKQGHWQNRALLLAADSPEDLYERSLIRERLIKNIVVEKEAHSYKYRDNSYSFLPAISSRIALMDMEVYHPDDILVKVDRSAMAVSLETRVPFLDRDVVEFAWTLPTEYKQNEKEGKLILKDVLYRYVPKELMERPKTGFAIPLAAWLQQKELREWANSLLDRKTIKNQGLLDADTVDALWNDYLQKGIWTEKIWYILMFQDWIRRK